jgi:hypothetical protein
MQILAASTQLYVRDADNFAHVAVRARKRAARF